MEEARNGSCVVDVQMAAPDGHLRSELAILNSPSGILKFQTSYFVPQVQKEWNECLGCLCCWRIAICHFAASDDRRGCNWSTNEGVQVGGAIEENRCQLAPPINIFRVRNGLKKTINYIKWGKFTWKSVSGAFGIVFCTRYPCTLLLETEIWEKNFFIC